MATGHENRDNQKSGTMQGAAGGQGADWESLKGDVGDMAGAALDQGMELLGSAKDQASGYADQRKDELAQSVVNLANTLRESGGTLAERPQIRAVVEGAAGGLEQIADSIRERSIGDMFGDVEDLVRRQPALAAVAAMTAGFLVARFAKASVSAGGVRPNRSAQGSPIARPPSSGQMGA